MIVRSCFIFVIHAITGIHGLSCTSSSQGQRPIPITILSGFLGSGKTTLLQHLLNNSNGVKIAVVVNDVAEVNIDNKLIVGNTASSSSSKQARPAGIVQLSNGCACCSLSDELLPSVSELITLSDMRCQASGDDSSGFDHIVIELSGVASPRAIRANFQDAEYYGMPLMDRVRLDTIVTVVDCSTFLNYIQDREGKLVDEDESPQLFYKDEKDKIQNDDDKWLFLERKSTGTATVSQLLVEQTEISDVVLLNKIDLLKESDPSKLESIQSLVKALNPRAKVIQTKFGIVEHLEDILAVAHGLGVADAGITDDHRDSLEAMKQLGKHEESSSHHHEHSTGEVCTNPECSDPGHSHSHSHEHANEYQKDQIPGDIGSFVFRARRPFHPTRLLGALKLFPIVRGLPVGIDVQESTFTDEQKLAMSSVIRSKGFCWLADSHIAAYYWSHAGSSFEIQCLGRWWATLSQDEWPQEAREEILLDFDNPSHQESNGFGSVGDRRQEIVLIGKGLNDVRRRTAIQKILESCLVREEEYCMYKTKALTEEETLKHAFENSIPVKMMTF
jgi:Putative GTPases (G3E family)